MPDPATIIGFFADCNSLKIFAIVDLLIFLALLIGEENATLFLRKSAAAPVWY